MREPREDQLVEIAQHRLERLAVLRRRLRQPRAHLAGLDARADRELADTLQVGVGPRGGAVEVALKLTLLRLRQGYVGRFFRSFSICFHVRVFRTSSFVSHARRAWPTPSST